MSGVSGGLRPTYPKTPGKSVILPCNLESDHTLKQRPPTHPQPHKQPRPRSRLQPHIHSRNHPPAPHHFTSASLLLYRVVLVGDAQAEGTEDELAVGVEDGAGKGSHRHGHETRRAAPSVEVHESAEEGGASTRDRRKDLESTGDTKIVLSASPVRDMGDDWGERDATAN